MLRLKLALLSTVCLLPYASSPAMAANAGVTAAVNQSAHATAPGGTVRTIVLGDNIVQDEEIKTDGKGLVQILLADGTTFTVGPNSALTIDKFVYNPDAGTAQVSASLTRGVFRFIGGRTSKTPGGVTLNTPVGTVGIRGAVADINLAPTGQNINAQIDLIFGQEVTLTPPGGGAERIYQPGYSIVVGDQDQARVTKTPPGSANQIQEALAGQPGTSGGSPNKPSDETVGGSGVPGTNSNHDVADNTPVAPGFTLPQPDGAAMGADAVANAVEDAFHLLVEEETNAPPPTDPAPSADTRFSGQFRGFSTGLSRAVHEHSDGTTTDILYGDSHITFDANNNSIGGTIQAPTLYDQDDQAFDSVSGDFGDASPGGTSNYAANDDFSATGAIGAAHLYGPGSEIPIESGTGITVSSTIPNFNPCTCDYMRWGSWAMQFNTGQGGAARDFDLSGFWTAGDIPQTDDFENVRGTLGNATYLGKAIGQVQDMTPDIRTATGDMTLTFDFDARSGMFDITNFDGNHSFSNAVSSDTGPQFSGYDLEDTEVNDGYHSIVQGAFVNDGTTSAAGVIGQFESETDGWSAVGVFVGQR